MNRISKVLILVILMLLVIVPLAGAKEDDGAEEDAQEGSTISDIVMIDGRFDTFLAAAIATGLDDDLSGGEWTVFAPTDDVFEKAGLNSGNITTALPLEDLTDILLYHLLTSSVPSAEAKTMLGDITMANEQIAGLKFFDDSLWVNDDSRVIVEDILASNGTIHVVDNVILPPWPRVDGEEPTILSSLSAAAAGNSIADIAIADGRFTTLVAAVIATDLAGDLSTGEWTAFAPTDEAFAKLGLDAGNIASTYSKEELTDILLYHVMTSSVSSVEAKTMLGDVTMANGKLAGLKYFDDSLWVNDDSRVIKQDILADNGIIHVVDTVILGPWPR